ncbi:MAG: hypothetical protein HZA81_03200 [Candidatus Taylorbacteria bacterium]|nr:hypothetical protein [Candidatus Taylorbacteria bacterium]
MHPHIRALRSLLEKRGVAYQEIASFADALIVGGAPFIRATTPFNDESVSALCQDKAAVHEILKGKTRMPDTREFLDPRGRHPELCNAKSLDEIVKKSLDFLYPRMVKMNKGERGHNVFFAENETDFRKCFERIFDKGSRYYDYIALVQEYVEPKFEYRVALAAGAPVFAYARGEFDRLDRASASRLFSASDKILESLPVSWGSLDFIESKGGDLYFLEANTRPSYEGFIAKNGDASIQELYSLSLDDAKHAPKRSQMGTLYASLRRFGRVSRFYQGLR